MSLDRPGRLRRSAGMRALVRETRLDMRGLVQPVFLVEDDALAGPIPSMPGVERIAIGQLDREADRLRGAGVEAVLLFGVPRAKDAEARAAQADDGIVPQGIRRLRERWPNCLIATDVCLCAYTDHGHCGLLREGRIDFDASLASLAAMAVGHAAAGADLVAPSAMLDGAIRSIREALDGRGYSEMPIMAYTVKYASSFYGPFRDAACSAPAFGDRRSHQMDPANGDEAIVEAAADLAEGADMLLVKPGLPALDIVRRLHERWPGVPIASYQVSGEYAGLVAAAERGWIDLRRAALESLVAIRRAGASVVVTYFADRVRAWLREED
jgi:porphobilinogen synthase